MEFRWQAALKRIAFRRYLLPAQISLLKLAFSALAVMMAALLLPHTLL